MNKITHLIPCEDFVISQECEYGITVSLNHKILDYAGKYHNLYLPGGQRKMG